MKEEIFEKILTEEMVLVDKPAGMTSFGVVARVRRVLSEYAGKKVKVGHTGTLDPFATGLMILMVGKGTKRCGEFLKKDKEYVAKLRLGFSSTTGDIEGKISRAPVGKVVCGEGECRLEKFRVEDFSKEKMQKIADGFLGEITQRVPQFSAVKIQGRRAYDLARKGIKVEMPERKVKIYEMEILGVSGGVDDFEKAGVEVEFRAKVSSGTYIRTLGEDFAKALGTKGYLTELRRTEIGNFRVEEAIKLSELGVEG